MKLLLILLLTLTTALHAGGFDLKGIRVGDSKSTVAEKLSVYGDTSNIQRTNVYTMWHVKGLTFSGLIVDKIDVEFVDGKLDLIRFHLVVSSATDEGVEDSMKNHYGKGVRTKYGRKWNKDNTTIVYFRSTGTVWGAYGFYNNIQVELKPTDYERRYGKMQTATWIANKKSISTDF